MRQWSADGSSFQPRRAESLQTRTARRRRVVGPFVLMTSLNWNMLRRQASPSSGTSVRHIAFIARNRCADVAAPEP